jgi:hypothetical protein
MEQIITYDDVRKLTIHDQNPVKGTEDWAGNHVVLVLEGDAGEIIQIDLDGIRGQDIEVVLMRREPRRTGFGR